MIIQPCLLPRIARPVIIVGLLWTAVACSDDGTRPSPPRFSVSAAPVVQVSDPEDLGVPVDVGSNIGMDINDQGTIVGSHADGTRLVGFRWTSATGVQDLGNLGGDLYTEGRAINNSGYVVGASNPSGSSRRVAFLRSPDGVFQEIQIPIDYSFAHDINETGVVVGHASTGQHVTAFRWTAAGGLAFLEDLGGTHNVARSINDHGVIAGSVNDTSYANQPAVWSEAGELRLLPALHGKFGTAFAINNLGQVAGFSSDSAGHLRAVLWQADGAIRDLGTLGGSSSLAFGINDRGDVVGESENAEGEYRAFFWSAESGMLDLGVLPNPTGASVDNLRSSAFRINEGREIVGMSAYRINDGGQIVGTSGWATLWKVTQQ